MDVQTRIKQLFDSADGLLITAGAGMGVDSGLPDFRGDQGLWQHYPALGAKHLSFEQIANPYSFYNSPRLAWGFYGHRLQLYRKTMPHHGFQLLLELAQRLTHGYFVFTSNVDGQFQKAGFNSQHIFECHGSIHALQCLLPCHEDVWTANLFRPEIDQQNCQLTSTFPRCNYCGGIARPNLLMFNDAGWLSAIYDMQEKRLIKWLNTVSNPIVIEIGAGKAIPTVRQFSEQFAPRLIRINPLQADIPHHQGISLAMGGLDGIKLIHTAI